MQTRSMAQLAQQNKQKSQDGAASPQDDVTIDGQREKPNKQSRTKLAEGKDSKSAKQVKETSKADESRCNAMPEQPSAREIAAAEAARQRLYGNGDGSAGAVLDPATHVPRLPTGQEPVAVPEVSYVAREDLEPVVNATSALMDGLKQATEGDWVSNCGGLLLLRRVIAYDRTAAWQSIEDIMAVTLKHVKSLRSSLCKTAIMTATDIISAYKDDILPHLDVGGMEKPGNSLLAQLLLKASSNDKKFVIDETKTALKAISVSITPMTLLPHVLPQTQHKNPKVRGVAANLLADSLEQVDGAEWPRHHFDNVLKSAAKLVSDNTPDARSAAKRLIPLLHTVYDHQAEEKENSSEGNGTVIPNGENEPPQVASSWEAHCKSCLGGAALAVLKTN